ncbi:hypothetical protein BH10PSE12_BH10PSE12_14270 [soil metagenome]
MAIERIALAALLLSMTACAAVPSAPGPATLPAPPTAGAYGKPMPVIGETAKRLIATFGQPRLDIRERTVRKLQFANGRCVLDAYLYSSAKGKEPVVTYVDARLPSGQDTDANACAMALSAK